MKLDVFIILKKMKKKINYYMIIINNIFGMKNIKNYIQNQKK